MKKKIFSLILTGIMSLSLALSSCQYILPKSVVNASLNEKGELILTYSDNTTQNVGVVKGEDGKDGVDGKDGQDGKDGLNGQNGKDGVDGKDGQDGKDGVDGQNSACEHQFSRWETQIEATCTSIGYKTRTCSVCGVLDYDFIDSRIHTYGNSVDVVNIPCEQRLVNTTCSKCGDTKIEEAPLKHLYNENGVCTKCGDKTDFIESEEYIENIELKYNSLPLPGILWWNKDRTYGLKITLGLIKGFAGTPVHVQIPAYYNDAPITGIAKPDEWSTEGAFQNCTTLKSVTMPDTIERIGAYAFDGCTSLESVVFEDVPYINKSAFKNCTSLSNIKFLKKSRQLAGLNPFQDTAYWNNYDGDVVYLEDICLGAKSNTITKVKIKDGTTQIIENAFYESSITEVTIPGSIIYWYAAFHNAQLLEKVIIEEGVTSIDEAAFIDCKSLTEITLPFSLQSIEQRAFSSHEMINKPQLKRLHLSKSVNLEILKQLEEIAPNAEIIYYD